MTRPRSGMAQYAEGNGGRGGVLIDGLSTARRGCRREEGPAPAHRLLPGRGGVDLGPGITSKIWTAVGVPPV